ncbi:MAG: S1C family serine protease [Roseiflexaceae bacterium]
MFERLMQLSDELVGLVDLVRTSTVTITGMNVSLSNGSVGSGWVYDRHGHIVTNHHVVDGMSRDIKVQFAGRKAVNARVIGSDPESDLAVLACEDVVQLSPPLHMRLLPARLGELCFAVGSPLRFRESVSWGIVSGLSRQLPTDYGYIEESIQTDAAINPGNSGGPLVDCMGKVIGVNVAKLGTADNIGFAIAAEIVADIVPEIIAHGHVQRGTFGISIGETWADDGSEQQVIRVRRIRDVNTPFQLDDVILAINDLPIRRRYDVRKVLYRDAIGSSLRVAVRRSGERVLLDVPVALRQPVTKLPESD